MTLVNTGETLHNWRLLGVESVDGTPVATPLVMVTIVVEVANALMARAASPAFLMPTLAPLRTLAVLGATALVLDRIVEFLVLLQQR